MADEQTQEEFAALNDALGEMVVTDENPAIDQAILKNITETHDSLGVNDEDGPAKPDSPALLGEECRVDYPGTATE